ncbi:acyl-CoA dehydrogenase family member 11 isoform X2 [Columba livia]|uniref:acyl-CoA dehydrogenase family member 11 isoform X2 n=1 Tax=Columba livia TaxID=8932 RepID=UPI0031BBBB60
MFPRRLPWRGRGATCEPWQLRRCGERCQAPRGVNTTAGQEQQVGMREKLLEEPRTPLERRETETLFQEQPEIGNQYLEDALLRNYLKAHLPPQVLQEVNQDLERFGNRLLTKIQPLAWECEWNPPVFRPYDAWGQRVDRIITCSAWRRMKEIAAEEGLIAEAYERRYSNWSRMYQAVKLYLFSSSSGGFNCPLAMTDGAAKVIESLGVPGSLKNAFDHLTSRDPKKFWTSGQWMTERRGGSDVANGTETVARKQADGTYRLYGFKWFTSAADSDMALTLARVVDAEGCVKQGSSGLSLFFLKVRDEEGKLNNIQVQRLKDKLGTRQMATGELWLNGAEAQLISAEGRGVASISNMLNITRIHNVIAAVASMRRMINLSREYARRRVAFGKLLKDHPLHVQTMARMEVQTRGAFLLLMEIVRLLGLVETNMASEEDQLLLRLLVPVAKLYTGKQASAVVIEAMESFGGQGYMEDTGLPVVIRDTLVLSIWEGTTNVLSLDVLRSLTKSQGQALAVFCSAVQSAEWQENTRREEQAGESLESSPALRGAQAEAARGPSKKLELAASTAELGPAVKQMHDAIGRLVQFVQGAGSKGTVTMELAARDFSYSLARIYAGALLTEHAARPGAASTDISAAGRWCSGELCPVAAELRSGSYEDGAVLADSALVFGDPDLPHAGEGQD